MDFQMELETAVSAARRAGEILVSGRGRIDLDLTVKSAPVDVVTEIDRNAEAKVVSILEVAFPDDGIVGEEGANRASSSGRRWIIDPLDGTGNFIRGANMSAVSIGLEVDGDFTVGVVFNPFADELFSAVSGRGAFLNDRRLSAPTGSFDISAAYVGIDGGFTDWARAQRAYVAAELITKTGELRQAGSTALSLCHVAAGRLQAHVNIGSSIWDIAAGTVVAREAGRLVEGLNRSPIPTADYTIASEPQLVDAIHRIASSAVQQF